jgi:deoxyribose-phosphate aldolase
MEPTKLAPCLDFANHHPNATKNDIQYVCDQVIKHGFNAAFMNPYWVKIVRVEFGYTGKIGTIVSFPLGQETLDIKVTSAKRYADHGANELDAVCNISLIKEAKWDEVLFEMKTIVTETKEFFPDIIIKFIPECGFLTPDEIKKVAELMVQAKVDFFKTCSGMGPRGAIADDVRFVKEAVGDAINIKCAGGIDTFEKAEELIKAGAVRLGTSKALEIIGINLSSPASISLTHLSE